MLIKRRRTWRRPRHVFSSVWIVDGVWVDHKATQTLPSLQHLLYISQQPTEELSFSYSTMLRIKTIYRFCKSTPFFIKFTLSVERLNMTFFVRKDVAMFGKLTVREFTIIPRLLRQVSIIQGIYTLLVQLWLIISLFYRIMTTLFDMLKK